jgi:SpoVK/Ycf46/Vps4 family AAA+-type ATPase
MDKISIIKKVLQDNKENGDLWYLLALEYIEGGNVSEGLQSLSQCLMFCDNDIKGEVIELLSRISTLSNGKSSKNEGHGNLASDNQENFAGKAEQTSMNSNNKVIDIFETPSSEEECSEGEGEGKYDDGEYTEEDIEDSGKIKELKLIGEGRNVRYVNFDDKYPKVTFEDVGGLEDLKKAIELKIITPFKKPGLFTKFKKKIGGGILLYGPPGCGKTYIAKATAGECNASFLPVDIADILSPYFGQSAINVKEIFAEARRKKPCVLFMDELDTLGYSRSKINSDNLRPIIDQLLNEIDGMQNDNTNLLILGATNTPWDVDGALKRPGRFDKTIFVPPPDKRAREVIFRLKLKGKPIEEINYAYLASITELYSGADIENIVDIAAENVISEILTGGAEREISTKDLEKAIKKERPTTIDWLKTVSNYVKYSNQGGFFNEVDDFIKANKRYL